ncbi:MAG: flagellar biosynthesis protein FliQ [Candidatus Binatia bacterium]
MGIETVMGVGRGALELTLVLAGPVLLFGLAAGLLVSVFQAMTQINEITLTFIPKIAASVLALLLFGPWMLTRLVDYTTVLFQSLPNYVR